MKIIGDFRLTLRQLASAHYSGRSREEFIKRLSIDLAKSPLIYAEKDDIVGNRREITISRTGKSLILPLKNKEGPPLLIIFQEDSSNMYWLSIVRCGLVRNVKIESYELAPVQFLLTRGTLINVTHTKRVGKRLSLAILKSLSSRLKHHRGSMFDSFKSSSISIIV